MIRVYLPRGLVDLYRAPGSLEVAAGTPMEVLTALEEAHPGTLDRLCERTGVLREYILLFVDGERCTDLHASLPDGSELHIVGALAGG